MQLAEILPSLALELEQLLKNQGEAELAAQVPQLVVVDRELREALEPLLREVESLNERVKEKEYDRRIEQIAKKDYPKVALLQQVKAVGELILDLYPDYRRSASIPEEP